MSQHKDKEPVTADDISLRKAGQKLGRKSGNGPVNEAEGAGKILEQKVLKARAVLFWEVLWPKLAVLLSIIAVFLILTFYGFWPLVPSFVHMLGLLALMLAGIWTIVRLIGTAIPGREAALRRLEQASKIPHRPASSYDDTLAELSLQEKDQGAGQVGTSSILWHAHRTRMMQMISKLKAGWPKASLERFDPFAVRALAVLLVIFGFAMHGPQSWLQIKSAFSFSGASTQDADIRIDAWLTPPSFTGKNPIMLSDGSISLEQAAQKQADGKEKLSQKKLFQDSALSSEEKPDAKSGEKRYEVLENALLMVRIIGQEAGQYSVRQVIDKKTATLIPFEVEKEAQKPEKRGQTNLKKLSFALKHSATIEILEGTEVIRSWPIDIIADLAPAIFLSKDPEKTPRSALLLTYQIADDFGVTHAQAKILQVIKKQPGTPRKGSDTQQKSQTDKPVFDGDQSPADKEGRSVKNINRPLGEKTNFDLKLPVASLKRGEAKTYKDLTGHPWAGLPVKMQLEVNDQGGKTGRSDMLAFKLPERKFTKSTARALIELRRYLVLNPADYGMVARGINMLSAEAEKHKIDSTAYLSMRDMYWHIRRLQRKRFTEQTRTKVSEIVEQMWETALRIEDGNLSKAERDLRRAQDKLADAISRNASPQEIEQLMKELRQALGKYMQARRQQQQKQADTMQQEQQLQQQGKQQSLTSNDLNQMLKRIEEMAKSGSKDAAQQMLNQLRDMLEGLQSPQQQNANNAQGKKMMELMDKFGKLAKQQQDLQERTFQQNRQNMPQQGQNNRFGRSNQFNRLRPWNNPRQFGSRGQRDRFGRTDPDNPYYRRGRRDQRGQQGRQGRREQRGQQGQGEQGQRGNNRSGQRNQNGQGGRNNFGRPGSEGGEGRFNQGEGEKLADEQRGLRRQLDELMNELGRMGGAVPRELGKARQQMGQAGQQLKQNELGDASKEQGKALESLRKGAKKMAQEMMKKMNRRYGSNGRDPLGRQRGNNGFDPGMDVKVPDEIDTQRAREILEELRRRLGEVERSPAELDYLESLIKRF